MSLSWVVLRPLLRVGWTGKTEALAVLWGARVHSVVRTAARAVWKRCRGLIPDSDARELEHDVMDRLVSRAVAHGGLTPPSVMGSEGAGGWLYMVCRNAAVDAVDAHVRAAGGIGRGARAALRKVSDAVLRVRAATGRPPAHAEVAAELDMPLASYWSMLLRHGIQLDGWYTASIVVPANGTYDIEHAPDAPEQEGVVITAQSSRIVEAAVRSGRMRPCHRLAWLCTEQPWALDDAAIAAAADTGLARSAEATGDLLDRWLALAGTGVDDSTVRLVLAWILRSDAPLLADDVIVSAEAWSKADPDAVDRARDLVRKWIARARDVVARAEARAA